MHRKLAPFLQHLPKGARILDIGSGGGLAVAVIRELGMEVVPLDIMDGAYDATVTPVVYDGKQIPFNDKSFDAALLLTVLHHIDDPDPVLLEAARVAKRVMIIEDIYSNALQRYLTYAADSLVNACYAPCPHTNLSDAGWKTLFQKMETTLEFSHYRTLAGIFRQAYYVIRT